MREVISVASEVISNPKVTGVIASGFVGQWWLEWGSFALQLFTSLLGIAALSVSLVVNLQTMIKNHRESKQEKKEKDSINFNQ